MNWINTARDSASLALKGVNWQLAFYRLILIGLILIGCFASGVYWEKSNQKDGQIAQAKAQVQEVILYVPEISKQEQRAAELKNNLATKQGRYNEAVEKGNNAPSCDLSDDELRALQELAQ